MVHVSSMRSNAYSRSMGMRQNVLEFTQMSNDITNSCMRKTSKRATIEEYDIFNGFDIYNKGIYSPEQGAPSLQLLNLLVSPSVYSIPVLETDWYMPVYHTGTSF
jgi:hypothetical protein